MDLKKSQNITNVRLAEKMGINESTFRDRMRKKNFKPNDIAAIAIFFKKPISYFYDREENEANEGEPSYTIKQINCLECIEKQNKIDELIAERDSLRVELLEVYRDKKNDGKCG